MKRVQIDGVGVVGFPDDWSREQIEAAIEKDILPRRATGSGETVLTATRGVTKTDVDKARAKLASEIGPLEAIAIGGGRFLDKAARGLEQAVKGDWLPDAMRSPEAIAAARERLADARRDDEAYAPLAQARPVATAAGGIAATLPFGLGATTLPRAIMWGMAPGALEVGSVDEKAIGAGSGAVGGALGNALGNLIAKLAIRRGSAALNDAERAELVKAARDAGIDLMPHQVTGKTWQKNLHGALRENPFTSSQYDQLANTQRAQVDAATESILRSIGGRIDQPSAGAAAQRGIQKGLADESQVIDKAYSDVLRGIDVDLTGTRAPLAQILAEQQKLPADVASAKAGASLRNMLGGEQGMQLDAALAQVLSPDKLKLFQTISGQHGPDAAMAMLPRADQQMVRELTKSGPAGFLRDSPTVPGTLAQDIRSAYTKASAKAAEHGDVQGTQAYARMRQAVDDAIEASVPASKRGQFDAVNKRYGFGAALKNLPERDQQVLLNQIYRGMGSEDEFATFIAMAPNAEFRDVQRGFLTKLVEGAEKGGEHVNPAALGRTMAKLDPEALRVLGGDAGKDLFEVGRVGEKLLPDLANSQTANRAYWLRLLNPSIMLAGASAGAGAGGGGLDFQTIAGAGAGAVLAPKLVSKMYLSPALRGWLEKMPQSTPANKLAQMVPPELEADFVRALSAFGIASPIGLDAARRNTD